MTKAELSQSPLLETYRRNINGLTFNSFDSIPQLYFIYTVLLSSEAEAVTFLKNAALKSSANFTGNTCSRVLFR